MRSMIPPLVDQLVRGLSSEAKVGALKGTGAGQERTTFVQNLFSASYRVFAELEKRVITPPSQDPLTRLTAQEAAKQIREGKLTSFEYVKAYIERIRDADRYINAVSELYEYEALEQAKEVDSYLKGLDRNSEAFQNLAANKPLLGIPVSVKHSFDVKGWRNICGLPHLRQNPPAAEDAGVIKKVREAGGIPLCYTNVPEACFWAETSNKVYGTTCSPYDDRTTPGGSSGGEGALLAAEGSILGIGSDFGGSLRNPAFMNGIFSFKPVGTDIPIEGHFPYNDTEEFKTVAVAGPMTRYAKDMALFFSALSGKKIPDNYASLKPTKVLHTLDSSEGATPLSPVVKNAVHTVADALAEGFSIKNEAFELQPFQRMVECLVNELVHPYPHDGGLIKAAFPDADKSNFLSEMYKCILGFGKINPGTCLAIKTFSEPKSEAEHHRMHDELLGYRKWIDSELKQNVVLVAPPLPQNHYFHHVHKISGFSDWHSTAIFNGLAVPVACAPIGLDSNGYPMSVQLVSARGNEFLLMRMQEFLEEKFGGWQPPRKFE